jgi:hypothetical protein
LTGREKVIAKNGPFSLTFCQIVALMFPHRSVVICHYSAQVPDFGACFSRTHF